jgi:hypothetical protein
VIFILDQVRRTIASRPLWLFLALLLISLLIRRTLGRDGATVPAARFPRYAAAIGLIYYVAIVIWYAWVPQQLDYAEPTITCVAWLFSAGKALYHAIDSAERYSHMYGPMAFIVPAVALKLLGPSMLVGKAVGVVAALVSLALLWATIRHAVPKDDRWGAALACGLCVLQFLVFRNLTFWSRPEPLQLVAVSAGLFAAVRLRGVPAAIVVALSMGLLWNLKFTGPLYSLPILAVFFERSSRRLLTISIVGAAVVAVLPFVVIANVSWSSYRFWVELSAQNGLRVSALKENLEWSLFLLLPLLIRLGSATPLPPHARLAQPAVILGVLGVVVAASKPGAGAYHFAPFLPSIAYVLAIAQPGLAARKTVWLTPFAVTLVFIALIQQQYFLRLLLDDAVHESYSDVKDYLDRHPGERVAMGYTSAERMTFARTLIVFRTNEYLLDVPAIQEHQLSGLALPSATTAAIRACAVQAWLLPQAGEPFEIRNDYPTTGYAEIFPPEFIAAFRETYTRRERTRYYDVWRCRGTVP